MTSSPADIAQFTHTPFYCEENVYFLIKKLTENGTGNADGSDLFVVFVSNDKKQVPLWHQKASHRADGIVLWDYHVICIQRKQEGESSAVVWDLDSNLQFPSPLAPYVAETIRPSFQLFAEFESVGFSALCMLQYFFDALHLIEDMKDSGGNWNAQPPAYDPIVAEDGAVHNLNEYMEFSGRDVVANLEADAISSVYTQRLGVVMSERQLETFFSKI